MDQTVTGSQEALDLPRLQTEARLFAEWVNADPTFASKMLQDGKSIGTRVERGFKDHLRKKYEFQEGSAALGIDFPALKIDIKTTSEKRPQSSAKFASIDQIVYGLEYGILLFVYEADGSGAFRIKNALYIPAERTSGERITRRILAVLRQKGGESELRAVFNDFGLELTEERAALLAARILKDPPAQGFLGMGGVPQWRLRYAKKKIVSPAPEFGVTRL